MSLYLEKKLGGKKGELPPHADKKSEMVGSKGDLK